MDATRRFAELVTAPDVPLDEAALLIAAHDHPVDLDVELERLDALAGAAPDGPDALARYLFVEQGFIGNTTQYHDPRNSFLDEVLRRRRGIPISLSLLMLEIGRRRNVPLVGVGLPGHFLVGGAPGVVYDPFHRGERLDEAGAAARFATVSGTGGFSPRYLDPVDNAALLARLLANLVGIFVPRDPVRATWALRLRLCIPGLSGADRLATATALGRIGHYAEAARELDALTATLDEPAAQRAQRDLAAFRARAN